MIAIFDLIALGVLALIAFGVWKSLRAPRQYIGAPSTPEGAKVPLSDPSPVKFAALLRRASENTRAKLEVRRELTKLLAENRTEDEVCGIVAAACDADFGYEGYRAWLTWLLGRFNAV